MRWDLLVVIQYDDKNLIAGVNHLLLTSKVVEGMKLNLDIMKSKERQIETFESQILSADEPCEGDEIFQLRYFSI